MSFRILIILVLFSGSVSAQSTNPNIGSTAATFSANRNTKADTVQAIHNLFRHRRTGGQTALAFAAATIAAPVIIGKATDTSRQMEDLEPHLKAGIIVSLPLWIIGIYKWGTYSRIEESNLVQHYQAGEPIPKRIRKNITARYFK